MDPWPVRDGVITWGWSDFNLPTTTCNMINVRIQLYYLIQVYFFSPLRVRIFSCFFTCMLDGTIFLLVAGMNTILHMFVSRLPTSVKRISEEKQSNVPSQMTVVPFLRFKHIPVIKNLKLWVLLIWPLTHQSNANKMAGTFMCTILRVYVHVRTKCYYSLVISFSQWLTWVGHSSGGTPLWTSAPPRDLWSSWWCRWTLYPRKIDPTECRSQTRYVV